MIHRPAIVDEVVERNLNDFGGGTADAARRLECATEIEPVETQNNIGLPQGFGDLRARENCRRADMERMIGRERGSDAQIGRNACAQRFSQSDAGLPRLGPARNTPSQNDWVFGGAQQGGSLGDQFWRSAGDDRRHKPLRVDLRQRLGKGCLLHLGVQIDVDGALRRALRDPSGAQQRFARGRGRGGLIVPFHEAADERALVLRSVNPIDPRPALRRIDWPRRAEHDHRHSVAPGIEHRHAGVHQADIGVDGRGHGFAGDLGIAVRNGDRMLFVQAQKHLRPFITEIIDQTVVQAPIAGTGIERDERNVERAERIGDDVATESGRMARHARGAFDVARCDGFRRKPLVCGRGLHEFNVLSAGLSAPDLMTIGAKVIGIRGGMLTFVADSATPRRQLRYLPYSRS